MKHKFHYVLLFLLSISLSGYSYAQNGKVNIDFKEASLDKIIKEIGNQASLSVVYNTTDVINQHFSIKAENEEVKSVIDRLLKGSNISYKIKDNHLVLATKQKSAVQPSVNYRVKGNVKDEFGEPLIGVSISIKGSKGGAITDLDGNFKLEVPNGSTLEISYIGYTTQTIPINKPLSLNLILKEDAKALDEVVVTALGIKRSEKALSYNVQQVKDSELTRVKNPNFVNSLSGKIAGVTINPSSSGVGGATKVVMRGAKSIVGDNNVLYVIDGMPMGNQSRGKIANEFEGLGGGESISDFNPEDIESISVLTGPSAAALYGAAAANGVILINTKKGEEGKAKFTVSSSSEFMKPFVTPKFQNRYGNALGSFKSWGDKLETPTNYNPLDFLRTGSSFINSANLSLGTQKNQTFISVAATNSNGIIPNNEYNRYNFSVRNTTSFLDDKMHLDVSASYIMQDNQNMLSQGRYFNPLVPLYLFPRGEDFEAIRVYERYDTDRKFPVQYWPYGDQGIDLENPYWIVNREKFTNKKKRYMLHARLQYNILDWLNVSGRVRVDNTNSNIEKKLYASTLQLHTQSPKGSYTKSLEEYRQTYADLMLNVNKTIGDFNITANLGTSFEDHYTTGIGIGGKLFRVPNLFSAYNFDPSSGPGSQSYRRTRNTALFASAEVGFRNRLYLTMTGRNDWASQLVNSSEPSIFYPSIGLSGIISEMVTLPSFISFLKLRTSYTEVGSPISQVGITPGTVTDPMNGGNINPISTYPFPDFKAERTKSYEVGMDLRLFDNRINIDATYYQSNTSNQTFLSSMSPASGYSGFYVQAGDVRNRGFEMALSYNDQFGDLTLSSNLTYTMNRNKIVEMVRNYKNPIDGSFFDIKELNLKEEGGTYLREGDQIGDIYVQGILQRDRDGNLIPEGNSFKVDKTQRIRVGSSNPKYTLGWRNDLSYKNFTLSFLLNARVGGVVSSTTQAFLDEYGVSKESGIARDEGAVIVDGKEYDPYMYFNTIGGQKLGAYYVYSATNIRLQEASLSYSLPGKYLNNIVDRITLSLIGRNLFMLYNKAPFDPEMTSSTGTYTKGDYFMPPSLRSVGFSVKFQF